MTSIAENIASLRQCIRGFELKYDRPEGAVKLLAVSKRHNPENIRQAAEAGIKDFGENYLQEANQKMALLADLELCWHFIGPIQANKTRGIAEHFDWVHSVDREKIAQRLNDQRPDQCPPLNVCAQVNQSAEASKSGTDFENIEALCNTIEALPRLRLRGLMTIPAPLSDLQSQRDCFRQLTVVYRELRQRWPSMDTLSMGMSNDLEAAIAEGSTLVRLGTAIFGPRP
ncbi:MAG: YggS family pyridoxal phosphate-dependent enzyme [Proteobacteria bacterium]|nr:YggS family pyridoxal phosphate-dependent enzyme [Pseudomonadota bacterium]